MALEKLDRYDAIAAAGRLDRYKEEPQMKRVAEWLIAYSADVAFKAALADYSADVAFKALADTADTEPMDRYDAIAAAGRLDRYKEEPQMKRVAEWLIAYSADVAFKAALAAQRSKEMIGVCLVCNGTFEGSEEDTNGPNAMCAPCYKKRKLNLNPPGWYLSPPPPDTADTEPMEQFILPARILEDESTTEEEAPREP